MRDPLVDPLPGDRVQVGHNKHCFREISSRAGGWVHFDFWHGSGWGEGGVMRLKAWRDVCAKYGVVIRSAAPGTGGAVKE